MNLTDHEKRDAVKLIEAGKPLPDKYRFLLFEDKREVELVWNGKTSEVCNVVLPFQVIEQVDEPRTEKPEDTKDDTPLFTDASKIKEPWSGDFILKNEWQSFRTKQNRNLELISAKHKCLSRKT